MTLQTIARTITRAARALHAGAEHVAEVLNTLPGAAGRKPARRRARR